MEMGSKGLELLKSFESCSLKAYKGTGESNYTIGWGHCNASIKSTDKITQAQADAYLVEDLKYFENLVTTNASKFSLNQNQFDALVDYTYNRGIKGLKELISNSKSISDISKNILIYWGSNTAVKTGLMKRRNAEKTLFDTAVSKSTSSSTTNPYKVPSSTATFKVGTVNSSYIKWIQFELNRHGASLTIDGEYGSKTAAQVKLYQKAKGLTMDGVAGPKTIASLKENAK
jgi:GH24 family phage-related lysozyme (muramidase)